MTNFWTRMRLRACLISFLPFYFVAILLAAPRMLIDWQLRRDWIEDFGQFFQKRSWVDLWDALKAGEV